MAHPREYNSEDEFVEAMKEKFVREFEEVYRMYEREKEAFEKKV